MNLGKCLSHALLGRTAKGVISIVKSYLEPLPFLDELLIKVEEIPPFQKIDIVPPHFLDFANLYPTLTINYHINLTVMETIHSVCYQNALNNLTTFGDYRTKSLNSKPITHVYTPIARSYTRKNIPKTNRFHKIKQPRKINY